MKKQLYPFISLALLILFSPSCTLHHFSNEDERMALLHHLAKKPLNLSPCQVFDPISGKMMTILRTYPPPEPKPPPSSSGSLSREELSEMIRIRRLKNQIKAWLDKAKEAESNQ